MVEIVPRALVAWNHDGTMEKIAVQVVVVEWGVK